MSSKTKSAIKNKTNKNKSFNTTTIAPVVEKVVLPTQVVEKPIAVHEEVRREQVEEIQPVISVEKLSTEIHQVTQPLTDKEIKPVAIQQRVLPAQVLPEITTATKGISKVDDVSTVVEKASAAVIIEKPAIVRETDKLQVIEEIQPVLFKETVVPTVIQETKPVYQKIVEGPVYSQETLAAKDLSTTHELSRGYIPSDEPAPAPVVEKLSLPVQVIEKPMTVHEEIRKELVEEVQPVISIEKLQTEVRQITQPLLDKEIKPVTLKQETLATQVLPDILLPGTGAPVLGDISTLEVKDVASVVIEKPAIIKETDKLRIIEEIQPILYKETIIPSVLKVTKPIHEKIIEAPIFIQQTLPAIDLSASQYRFQAADFGNVIETYLEAPAPVIVKETPVIVKQPELLVETKKTTTLTTTTTNPVLPTYAL